FPLTRISFPRNLPVTHAVHCLLARESLDSNSSGKRGHCMSFKQFVSKTVHGLRVGLVAVTVFQFALGGPLGSPVQAQQQGGTSTPIKHVIILIGENRTFDNLFATYVSPSGDHVSNLLSEGIINADGTPGQHFSKAAQFQAVPPFRTKFYVSLN